MELIAHKTGVQISLKYGEDFVCLTPCPPLHDMDIYCYHEGETRKEGLAPL